MKVLRTAQELAPGGRCVCVAIGVFDGVHLGHQQVLGSALKEARSRGGWAVAVTFDRHPQSILNPSQAPELIQPMPQKLRQLEQLGMDAAWVIQFDLEFSRQPARAFLESMAFAFAPLGSVSVGENFVFGSNRAGNVDLLHHFGQHSGFVVHAHPPVRFGDQIVSSTRIREAIASGDLADASNLLGRPYSLSGRVLPGQRLGRQLGFPTANVDVTGLVVPPFGVYVARAIRCGRILDAVLNLGARPTVSGGSTQRHCEVHLLDFDEDLYGEELEVRFLAKLRDEARFPSMDALKAQIRLDVAEARRRLLP